MKGRAPQDIAPDPWRWAPVSQVLTVLSVSVPLHEAARTQAALAKTLAGPAAFTCPWAMSRAYCFDSKPADPSESVCAAKPK
jgi:hypothetical protein